MKNSDKKTRLFDDELGIELTPEILAFYLSLDFSNQVIALCEEEGISQAQLAEMLKIGASTLSEKLNGQNMTLKSMASIALALDCDMEAPRLVPSSVSGAAAAATVHEFKGITAADESAFSGSATAVVEIGPIDQDELLFSGRPEPTFYSTTSTNEWTSDATYQSLCGKAA